MNTSRAYTIAFVGLKPGVHVFKYDINDQFFERYKTQDFVNCNAQVTVNFEKNTSFFLLKFDIAGTVDAVCDRCANLLVVQLWDEFSLIVKMVEEPETFNENEEDPDIYYIGFNDSLLDLSDWIYEFINLSIPTQKLCGDDENGHSKCNPEVLAKLAQMNINQSNIQNDIWKNLPQIDDTK